MDDREYVIRHLKQLDTKIDKLVDAMTELVEVKTIITHHAETLHRFGHKFDNHETRIKELEVKIPLLNMLAGGAKTVVTVVGTLLISAMIGLILV